MEESNSNLNETNASIDASESESTRTSTSNQRDEEQSEEEQASAHSQQSSPDSSNPKRRNSIAVEELFKVDEQKDKTSPTSDDRESQSSSVTSSEVDEMTTADKLKKSDLDVLVKKHMSVNNTLFELREKLTIEIYEEWNETFCAKMRAAALFKLINGDWEESAKQTEDWKSLDQLAKDNILMNISSNMKNFVRGESTAKAMYDKIILHCEGNAVMRGWRLCKQLKELMSNETNKLDEIAMNYSRVVDNLRSLFPDIPGDFYSSLYCAILPPQFDYIINDVQKADTTLDYKQIVDMTMAAYTRMKENEAKGGKVMSSIAAYTRSPLDEEKKKNKKKTKKKKPAQVDTVQNKPLKHCDYCRRDGHDDSYCIFKAKDIISGQLKVESPDQTAVHSGQRANGDQSRASKQRQSGENFTVSAFLMNVGESENRIDPKGIYIDTCAEVAVTNTLEGSIGEVRQMNAIINDWEGRPSRIHGVGNYRYLTETGSSIMIKDVVYKSTACATFLSYGKIMATGKFKVAGEDDWLEFRSKETNQVVMTARMVSAKIMKLELQPHPDTLRSEVRVCKVTIDPSVPNEFMYRFWHNQLGHPSFGYLNKQSDLLGLVNRLRERLVCDVCTATKATKLPFSNSDSIAERPFDLVHTDLSGIIRIGNVSDVNYFLLFMDDCTRFLTIYLLARKYQVPGCYEQYKNWAEVQFNATIKQLRSDNGTEFKNSEMREQTVELGTSQQFTAHGNPQQNGRAERPMRTIDTIARALLKQANLSIRFWPYAVLYAVWLKNRFPHAALNFESPFYKLYGKHPDLRNAKQFGSLWFVLDQKANSAFSDNAKPALFLGYPEGTKGAYVYRIEERKVDICRELFPSEKVFGTKVQTDSTYKIDESDSDVYMDPNNSYFARPLYEDERETVQDHLREQLEDSVLVEDDLANYTLCPSEASFGSYTSAHSELNNTLLVQEDCTLQAVDRLNGEDDPPVSLDSSDGVNGRLSVSTDGESASVSQQLTDQQASSSQPVDPTAEATNEKPKYLKELIDTRRTDHADYPRGRVIMNKKEKSWFQTTFPESTFVSTMPYRGKSKNSGKLSIVHVSAITAPKSYEQAVSGPYRHIFQPAMDREMACQYAARSYTLVKRPPGVQVLPTLWIYKYQFDSCGLVVGGKARLVILGNQQTYELGEQNYAPVVNHTSQRALLALAVRKGWHVHHIDCTTAFLNSPIKGKLYITQPRGYVRPGEEDLVGEVNRSVYGLRQSPRQWFLYLKRVMLGLGFRQLLTDSCVFFKRTDGKLVIIAVYVDDLQALSNDEHELNEFKKKFTAKIKATDHGEISSFLNVQYKYDRERRTLEIDQSKYIRSILKEAEFEHCRTSPLPIRTADAKKLQLSKEDQEGDPDFKSCLPVDREWYQVTLGKVMFVANATRFDFALLTSILCGHMHDPKIIHLKMLKQFLRYLQLTKDKKLVYSASNDELVSQSGIVVYADSSFEDEVSRVGMLAFVGGNLVSWTSRKQTRVATSTSESEILAVHDAVNEVEYLRLLFEELGFDDLVQSSATVLNDNLSAKASFQSGGKFDKNKHYKNRLNRVIRAIEEEIVSVEYVETAKMLADMLTKPLSGQTIVAHSNLIGLRS